MKKTAFPTKMILILSFLFAVGIAIYLLFIPQPVAKIGSWKIYPSDVKARDRVIRVSFPEAKESYGLKQLEQSARYLQVLEKNGVTLTKEEIEEEARRMDRSTKDPERLALIKAIFGEDREAYLKNYVLPALVARVLQFEFFPHHADIHALSLKRAQDLILKVQDQPKEFKKRMEEQGVPVSRVTLSLKEGLLWEQEHRDEKRSKALDRSPKHRPDIYDQVQKNQQMLRVQEAQSWFDEFIEPLQDGEILSRPINDRMGLLIVQRLKSHKNGEEMDLLIATVPKLDFETWYRSELDH